MRKTIFFFFSFLSLHGCVFSQAPQNWTSADMYLAIRKLNVLGSVLYVAAHPDDENTRLIAYFARDRMYRTGYLSLTRGDGGQNLIGDEQGIELGLIRTQELLAARRIDGGEQFFTRAFDFGFSKSPEETFTKWDREKILADVVWVIRKFQPDVIITRFPTTGEGGHGHHTASAILANEAFSAASDPKRFPEQLKYVRPWQAKRILWNSFNFGGTNLTSADQFKFDVGGYNPLLGKSYGEIAAISRSNHKSQGFGSSGSRGEALEYFKPTGGIAPISDIMDGVDLTWKRVPGGGAIEEMVNAISSSFDLLHPEKSVKGLAALYARLAALPEGYWKTQKMKETATLIEQCSGLFMEANAAVPFAVQTDSVRINFSFNNRLGTDARLESIRIDDFDSTIASALEKNRNLNFSRTFPVPYSKPVTQPYWLVNKMEEGYFNVTDQQKIGQADADPSYEMIATVSIYGQKFTFSRPVRYRYTDPVKGEIYEPLAVTTPVEFNFTADNNFSINDSAVAVSVHFKRNLEDSSLYMIHVRHSDKWSGTRDDFRYGTWQNPSNYATSILRPVKKNGNATEDVSLEGTTGGRSFFVGYKRTISYTHIPSITYHRPARTNVVRISLATYNHKIGYIVGAGDKVPEALEQMGYEVTLLGDKELSRNNLQQFDAIVTGVRAYNTNDWMNTHYEKLMKYVSEGGNLIVQYNTSSNIGPVRAKMGPYGFNISRNRITDENAQVSILKPEHPVFNFPNKITPDDFSGWIQERSIYHAAGWDKEHFETLLSMSDPGEKADEGSLIMTRYGKGVFVYTGLVFFRELPAGIPGAYRLLANIIALNSKKGF